MTFKIQADTAAEFQAFQNNEVSMIYPQPQLDVVDQIEDGLDRRAVRRTPTTTAQPRGAVDEQRVAAARLLAVRQAIGYAIDRDAIVEQLFGALGVEAPMQTLNPPILAEYADTEAWSQYELDLDRGRRADDGRRMGEERRRASGRRTARPRRFTIKTTAGNKRRELTEQILQEQLGEAGFEMKIENQEAGDALR